MRHWCNSCVEFKLANQWFAHQLKIALTALYDPTALRASPLAELLGPVQQDDPISTLRRCLLDSIESLRPAQNTPSGSRAWRFYQILRRRYTEALSQRQVAADLGLSIRQLQREEKLARETLTEYIWVVYDLESKVPSDAFIEPDEDLNAQDEIHDHSVQEELEWLRSSVPFQLTEIGELIQGALATVEPLMKTYELSAAYKPVSERRVPLRAAILRQALLDIMSTAIRFARGGHFQIRSELKPQHVFIRLHAAGCQHDQVADVEHAASLAMADQLIRLCDGSLQITIETSRTSGGAAGFRATIVVPVPEQAPVLGIDDNADALQLLQRYLADTPYLFIGAQDARQGLELAAELRPRAILLDVMMPEQDGWAVLEQLRVQPQTGHIPVIVCTLLSQRDLALALGATGFICKPVKRGELLSMLDRLLAQSADVPGSVT